MKKAAFTTCDSNYVRYAIVSLLSVRRWTEETDLFIFCREVDEEIKSLCSFHNITLICLDYTAYFYKSWNYPVECFYMFGVPEWLFDSGYEYSVYIDADIYCNADPWRLPDEVVTIAGVSYSGFDNLFGSDLAIINKNFELSDSAERVQSGVVYFNNKWAKEKGLLEAAAYLFDQCIKQKIPRKGDDSLLALLILTKQIEQALILDRKFNFIARQVGRGGNTVDDLDCYRSTFFHFTDGVPKPWEEKIRSSEPAVRYFTRRWREVAIDLGSDLLVSEALPVYESGLRKDTRPMFFWWGEKNVGDLVTPYMLSRNNYDPTEYRVGEREIFNETKRGFLGRFFDEFLLPRVGRIRAWRKLIKRIWQPSFQPRYIISTGSIARLATRNSVVFGSGVPSAEQIVRPSIVKLVRGPRTREAFLEAGVDCPPIYGDPGLLMPAFYTPKPTKFKYRLGLIPHFTEVEKISAEIRLPEDVLLIDMGCGDIEQVVDEICSCNATISSSLHGIVFSHAYKIPTRRANFSEIMRANQTKFHDYYEGIGCVPLSVMKYERVCDLISNKTACVYETFGEIDLSYLIDNFFLYQGGVKKSWSYWV